MRLSKLVGLEIEALLAQHGKTLANIEEYTDILENRSSMARVIIKELDGFKKKYGLKRRTELTVAEEIVIEEKKIEEAPVVFLMDRFGYARCIDASAYERNREAADSENRYVIECLNTDRLCLFTNTGNMHSIKVLDVPFGRFRDKGTPIDNFSNYDSGVESIVSIDALGNLKGSMVAFGTATGMIKLVEGSEFDVSKRTTAATKLADGDEVLLAKRLYGGETLVFATKKNMFLRITTLEIPTKKKAAIGVRGMKLGVGDEVKAYYVLSDGDQTAVEVSGKELVLNRLKISGRDTKGTRH